jgi:hypothetical protein
MTKEVGRLLLCHFARTHSKLQEAEVILLTIPFVIIDGLLSFFISASSLRACETVETLGCLEYMMKMSWPVGPV